MQIAVLLDIAAVCANVSVGFLGACYLTIKAVEVNDDYGNSFEEQRKVTAILEVLVAAKYVTA